MANNFGIIPDKPSNNFGIVRDKQPQSIGQPNADEGLPFLNIGAGIAAGVANPLIDLSNYVARKVLPSSSQPNFQHIQNLPFLNKVINPQSTEFSIGESAPLVGGIAGLMEKAIPSAYKALTPVKQVSNQVASHVDNLLNGTSLEAIPSRLAEMIRNAHGKVQDYISNEYGNIRKMAGQAGFNDDSLPDSILNRQLTASLKNIGMLPSPPAGNYIKTEQSLPKFESILSDNQLPTDVKDLIGKFIGNPSFNNAHILQNTLGNTGADFKRSNEARDKLFGNKLQDVRESLVNDINSSFENAGHPEIADKYRAASDYFKNNVLPYREISFLRSAIKGTKTPSALPANLMSDQKGLGNVLNHLNTYSPESNNLLVASSLGRKSALGSDLNGNTIVKNPNQIKENINSLNKLFNTGSQELKNNLNEILTPSNGINHIQNLSNMIDAYKRAERMKKGLKVAGGAAAALAIPQIPKLASMTKYLPGIE